MPFWIAICICPLKEWGRNCASGDRKSKCVMLNWVEIMTEIRQHFVCTCRACRDCGIELFNCRVWWCVAEPRYSVGTLPECAISRWQQAGSNHTKSGFVGWQEGVDQGRTCVTTQAHVWVAISPLYILYIFFFFFFLLQWCWCYAGWSENRSVLLAASSPFFTAWLLIRSNFTLSCMVRNFRPL